MEISVIQSYLWYSWKVFAPKQNITLKDSKRSFTEWLLSVEDENVAISETKYTNKDDGQIVVVDPNF